VFVGKRVGFDQRWLLGAMLGYVTELAAAADLVTAVASPLVALGAIGATVWTTRRTLDDRRQDRLWQPRAELYLDLVRAARRQLASTDVDELMMAIDTLDSDSAVHWEAGRGRGAIDLEEREALVLAYASEPVRHAYFAWDRAILQLNGVVLPTRETGIPRPSDVRSTVQAAVTDVLERSDHLIATIRTELLRGVPSRSR
jgi:hypothetical protein